MSVDILKVTIKGYKEAIKLINTQLSNLIEKRMGKNEQLRDVNYLH